jgi:hypothetical protein
MIISPGRLLAQKLFICGGDIIVNIDPSTNTGATTFSIRNDANGPNDANAESVFLEVDNFVLQTPELQTAKSKATKNIVPARVTFEYIDSNQQKQKEAFVRATVPKGGVLPVTMEISQFSAAGEAHADLSNGKSPLASIKAVKFNPQFKVGLSLAGADNRELVFRRGKPNRFVLKNEDSMTYPVKWSLFFSDTSVVLGPFTVVLPGGSTIPIELDLPDQAFRSWFAGSLKDYQQEGSLVLQFDPPGEVASPALPTKTIPVTIKMQQKSKLSQSIVSHGVILVTLLLGAIASLFLSLYIPNKLQSIELLGSLEKLSRKTQKISSNIDSALRVEARVERLRLIQIVKSVFLLKASAPTILKGYKSELELLDRRLGLIQELDRSMKLLESLRAKTTDAPAAVLDEAGKKLEEATERLKLSELKESDFQMVQETIQKANNRMEKIGCEDPELAKQLAEWVKKLKEVYADTSEIGKSEKCEEFRKKIKQLFDVLKSDFEKRSKIDPVHYHWLSACVERLFVLRHYIRLWDNATPEHQEHIKKHEEELLKCLRVYSWHALNRARQLRRQIKEECFADDVKNALAREDPPAYSISMVPAKPAPNQRVHLEVQFHEKMLNTCTARQDFSCEWNFGDDVGKEEGWSIWHYFREEKTVQARWWKIWRYFRKQNEQQNKQQNKLKFKVEFRDLEGKSVGDTNKEFELKKVDKPEKFEDKEKLELTRLAVALVVAVLALVAGAMEELMKLDIVPALVAIFLIGFGADTVKNIITGKPQGST